MSPELVNGAQLGGGIYIGSKALREIIIRGSAFLAHKAAMSGKTTDLSDNLGRNLLANIQLRKMLDVYLPTGVGLSGLAYGFIELLNGNYANTVTAATVAVPHLVEAFIQRRNIANTESHITFKD